MSTNNPIFGFDNVFLQAGATVSTSSEAVGFEKENAYDNRQYDWWKPTSTGAHWLKSALAAPYSCSYGAVWGHNLHEVGGSFKFQHSPDNSNWTDAHASVAPTDGRVQVVVFAAVSRQYWRVLVTTTTGASIIAGVQIGAYLELSRGIQAGMSAFALAEDIESKTAMSESGVLLGVSVRSRGVSGSINMSTLDPAWVRSDLVDLIDHLNAGKPCVFSWAPIDYPAECLLAWKGKEKISPPTYSSALFMSFDLPFEGVR
jgi:hypothetical protein